MAKESYIVIDIETCNLTEEQIEFEKQFIKHHPNTKDPDKQMAQVEKKADALLQRGALTNSADIFCVGFSVGSEESVVVLNSRQVEFQDGNVLAIGFPDSTAMLRQLAAFLDDFCGDGTEIVVAGREFDLPKIRFAMVKAGISLPQVLKPGSPNQVFDVLYIGGKYFMMGAGAEYSLNLGDLCRWFSIDEGKIISGAEVPDMIDRGEHKEVIVYNACDVLKTRRLYEKFTGQ